LIGKNCMLNVTHNQVGDKTYANVVSVMPLHKRMEPIAARDFVRKTDRTDAAMAGGSAAAMRAAHEAAARQAEYDEQNPPPITEDDMSDIPF
jgi:hypothetical protein